MSDDDDQEAMRSNAEVVFEALKSINGPATIKNVANYVAASHGLDPNRITEPVAEILTTGYNLGILTKKGAKYMLDPK